RRLPKRARADEHQHLASVAAVVPELFRSAAGELADSRNEVVQFGHRAAEAAGACDLLARRGAFFQRYAGFALELTQRLLEHDAPALANRAGTQLHEIIGAQYALGLQLLLDAPANTP